MASPTRKTQWSAALVESPDSTGLVSLDTGLANRLIFRALEDDAVDELGAWRLERGEHTLGPAIPVRLPRSTPPPGNI